MTGQVEELAATLSTRPVFRLGVTGSRDWATRRSVWTPLDWMLARKGCLIVINGRARRGVDEFVHQWTERFPDCLVLEESHHADWGTHGFQAGFLRNGEMVGSGMDALMVWANPCRKNSRWCPRGEHPTHGTADCVKQARAAGIRIHFSPQGMSW